MNSSGLKTQTLKESVMSSVAEPEHNFVEVPAPASAPIFLLTHLNRKPLTLMLRILCKET
jgi:hypothetical protein